MARTLLTAALGLVATGLAAAASPGLEAADACIEQVRAMGGPEAQGGGEILSSEVSQAGTLVMLRDAGGTVWRCVATSDGAVGEVNVVDAAEQASGAGRDAPGSAVSQRVSFEHGTTRAKLTGSLPAGGAIRYVLNARDGQFLYVRLVPYGADLSYRIFNPDGSVLLAGMSPDREYRGQLWQTGDHAVELSNGAAGPGAYTIILDIE